MMYVEVGARRVFTLALAMVLAVGALALLPATRADAAFPGGNGWIVFQYNGGGSSNDIYVMPSDGSAAPTNLTGSLNDAFADPVFSPDGSQIAVSRDVSGNANIWIADFNSTTPALSNWVQVTNGDEDGEPTWSPDGLSIAFVRRMEFTLTGTATNTDVTGVTLIDTVPATDFEDAGVDAGDAVENTTTTQSGTVASVDGDEITLAVGLAAGWTAGNGYTVDVAHRQIFTALVSAAPSAGTQISDGGTEPAYDDNYPSWSPDGTQVAFSTTRSGNSDVYLVASTGGTPSNLTGGFANLATRPNWSPDGSQIVFNSPEGGSSSNIWVIDDDGSNDVQLTNVASADEHATWSPDGTQIAFRRGGATGQTYVVPAAGGTATQVYSVATPAAHNEPDWQPALTGVADAYSVDEGATLIEAAPGVLTNDSLLGVGTATAVLDTDVANGVLTLNANGSFTYVHDDSETVSDSFTYHPVQNGVAGSVATVAITVNPVDEAPTADNDGPYGVAAGGTLTVVAGEGVLVGDVDPEGLTLSASLVADVAHGSLTLNANGSFTYVNDGSSAETDSFTYKAVDPGLNESGVATVSIEIGSSPPVVEIGGLSVGATGIESTFTSTVTEGAGTPDYAWTVSLDGTQVDSGTDSTFDFTPATGGEYVVALTVTDVIGSDSDSFEFTVIGDIDGSIFVGDIIWLADRGITRGCNAAGTAFCPTGNVTRGQMAAFLVRALGLTDDGGGNTFTDDDNSVFEADIAKLAAAGITRGCNADGTKFCPEEPVTRGQMAAFLVRAFGLTDDGGGNTFTDDDNSIFQADIAKLAASGITRGCNSDGTAFCPEGSVTRGQMAAFLHRAEGYLP